jgi:hypothetical protein
MSNGDVIWAGVADDHTAVNDPTKLYVVRIRWPQTKRVAGGTQSQLQSPAQGRMRLAKQFADKGDAHRARSILESLVRTYPDSPEAILANRWLESDGTTSLTEIPPSEEAPE